MITADCGITAYTDRYLLARDLSSEYAAQLRYRIERFCAWSGAEVLIDSVTCDLANEWLADLADGGMRPWTLDGYRRALLAVWNDAFQAGDNDHPPNRLRRVKKPRLIIEAYTHAELKQLLAAAANLTARHADGNEASDFWRAAIHIGYSCGARRGDVLNLEWSHVTPTGRLTFLQSKTQFAHTVQLSTEAIRFARKLQSSGKVLPWCYERNWFGVCFARLRDKAGVNRGSFRWLRRSAGSYAESIQPGAGARLLGHRDERMYKRHYEDSAIVGGKLAEPPPL